MRSWLGLVWWSTGSGRRGRLPTLWRRGELVALPEEMT